MSTTPLSQSRLIALVVSRVALFVPVMMLVLFLPAGTLAYWPGWVYLLVLLGPALAIFPWLLKNSPDLLANRMRMREEAPTQRWVVLVSGIFLVGAFVMPGLDFRWGWSNMPWPVVIAADVVVVIGYLLVIQVFRVNRFASRVVEVRQAQTVIDTGPYAIVRHPGYVGGTLVVAGMALALGSLWALLPAVVLTLTLVARTLFEERTLREGLPGYADYTRRVRFRWVPGVW